MKHEDKDLEKLLAASAKIDPDTLKRAIKTRASSTAELASRLSTTQEEVLKAINALSKQGVMVLEMGGVWTLQSTPGPRETSLVLQSDEFGWQRFGVISDTHYGSRYAREDVVDDLYRWFASHGIKNVFHCGNWIEGEAKFNKHELVDQAHGMQAQINYFVARYPRLDGITTHYVAGDDHEGWYFIREGVDIGAMLQTIALSSGRKDLNYLGYKEAFVTLQHSGTGSTTTLLVDHPGGGSAYADSYAAQKRIEAAQPGEKPGMWLFGHWHKLGTFYPRGVWVILAGCTKDLDTFGRKKGLRYDVGGYVIEAKQDPNGAIVECVPRLRTYFDRGYYNKQFGLDRVVQQ